MTDTCQTVIDEISERSLKMLDAYQSLESRIQEVHQQLSDIEKTRADEKQEKIQLASRLSLLFEVLPVGIVVLNSQGCIESANPEAERIFERQLHLQSWSAVIQEAVAPRFDDGLEVTLTSGKRISVKTSTLADQSSQLIILNDLTQTRHLLDEAAKQQRLVDLGSMVASLAHQVRTPLATATLYLGHLKNPSLPQASIHDYSQRALERLNVVNQMIEDMLLFVKGQKSPRKRMTLSAFFVELKQAISPQVDTAVLLTLGTNHPEVMIEVNTPALIGAILNCIHNSYEAALETNQQGLHIQVSTKQWNEESIAIVVADNGPGIAKEDVTKIFEAFYTTKSKGTGLGLAVVQAVMESHRGQVEVQSQPHSGTTFLLQLPVCCEVKHA